jgi:hypothetical protein
MAKRAAVATPTLDGKVFSFYFSTLFELPPLFNATKNDF